MPRGSAVLPPALPGGGGGGGAGITDTFTRTVSGGWGTADCGLPWAMGGTPVSAGVNGTYGTMTVNRYVGSGSIDMTLGYPLTPTTDALVKVQMLASTTDGSASFDLQFGVGPFGGSVYIIRIWDDGTAQERGDGGHTTEHAIGVAVGSWFWVRASLSPTSFLWRTWQDGAPEPGSWISGPAAGHYAGGFFDITPSPDLAGNDLTLNIDSLDITGVNLITLPLDNFNRTVALNQGPYDTPVGAEWGTASSGATWTLVSISALVSGTDPSLRVNGRTGIFTSGNGSVTFSVPVTAHVLDAISWSWTTIVAVGDLGLHGGQWNHYSVNAFFASMDVSWDAEVVNDGINGGVFIFTGAENGFAPITWAESALYFIEVTATASATELRVWLAGAARPSSPTVAVGPRLGWLSGIPPAAADTLYYALSMAVAGTASIQTDSISFASLDPVAPAGPGGPDHSGPIGTGRQR